MPLRWIGHGAFRALFLRREAKYLADAIDKSTALYPAFGGKLVLSPKIVWTFPSGAKIWLNHCEHESDVANYDSLEFHLVIFEELTHFTEKQYRGIRARIRGTDPRLPRATRATTNPGGPGHEWVFKRFGAWLDPQHPHPAAPNDIRWFKGDDEVAPGTSLALTRQFIPAKLADNPHVTAEYEATLLDLDPVRRAQLLGGNWLARPAAGAYFKRRWFKYVNAIPAGTNWVRSWDFAATTDGDWTVGTLIGECPDKTFIIGDVRRLRGVPGDVEREVRVTAELDGRSVPVRIPQDPGQAGKAQVVAYAKLLSGFDIAGIVQTGDKVVRAAPLSAQVSVGNVAIYIGKPGEPRHAWVEPLLEELEAFPEGDHDDQVDATAQGFNAMANGSSTRTAKNTISTSSIDTLSMGI